MNIDIKHANLSILDLIDDNKYIIFNNFTNLNNYFKTYTWTSSNKSTFIEKILLKIIPFDNINLYALDDNHYEILKGWEYLFTIYNFINDKFELEGMKLLKNLNGKKFSELEGNFKRKILEKTFSFYILRNNLLVDKESLKIIKEMMY